MSFHEKHAGNVDITSTGRLYTRFFTRLLAVGVERHVLGFVLTPQRSRMLRVLKTEDMLYPHWLQWGVMDRRTYLKTALQLSVSNAGFVADASCRLPRTAKMTPHIGNRDDNRSLDERRRESLLVRYRES